MDDKNLLPLHAYDDMIRAMMRPLLPMSLIGGLAYGFFMYFGIGDISISVAFILGIGFGVLFWFVFRSVANRLFTSAIVKAYAADELSEPASEPGLSYEFQLVCSYFKGLSKMIGRLCISSDGVYFQSVFPGKANFRIDFGSPESLLVKAAEPRKGISALLFGDMQKIELSYDGELHYMVVPSADFTANALRQGIARVRSLGTKVESK